MRPIPHDIVVIELGLEEDRTFPEEEPSDYDLAARPSAIVFRGMIADLVYQRVATMRELAAEAGHLALDGTTALLFQRHAEDLTPGVFLLTGGIASPRSSRVLSAGPGDFHLPGGAAEFRSAWAVSAGPGAFLAQGWGASFRSSNEFNAGVFDVVGRPAGLAVSRGLIGGAGDLTLSGASAGLPIEKSEPFSTGVWALAGTSAALSVDRGLDAQPGAIQLMGGEVTFELDRPTSDPNRIVWNSTSRLGEVELITAEPAALAYSPELQALVLRTNAGGATSRAYFRWKGKHRDGTYRYLTALLGTQPSSATRRGPLPFVRASFGETDKLLKNGYLTGPMIVSGATDRFNLEKAVAGAETHIIAENANRTGIPPWGAWRWMEIRVIGSTIAHRTYAAGVDEADRPAWQEVTDATYPQGADHGLGYQQGSSGNYLAVAEMEFIPTDDVMTNELANNKAMWSGSPPVSNTILNNRAVWS